MAIMSGYEIMVRWDNAHFIGVHSVIFNDREQALAEAARLYPPGKRIGELTVQDTYLEWTES